MTSLIKPCTRSLLAKTLPGYSSYRLLNQKNRARRKNYGIKIQPGEWAREGNKLVTQRDLRYHPGLNVGVGGDRVLYALRSGKVALTVEKVNPQIKDNALGALYYADRTDENIYKWFFHVIPPPQEKKFRLVASV